MTILLTPTHLDTIVQLIEIARKHDCQIFISTGACHYPHMDEATQAIYEYCCDEKGMPEDMREELDEKVDVDEASFLHEWICFELLEKAPNGFTRSNSLTYSSYEMELIGAADKDPWDGALSQKAEDWLSDHCSEYNPYLSGPMIFFDETDTTVCGFKGVDTKVNVYREGMAVKFFGDLVCDYLHEPQIKKVY